MMSQFRENEQFSPAQQFGVVYVTAPSQEQAQAIAQTLIADKLAACVTVFPVHSTYSWQGEVQSDAEWQLIIKSDLAKFEMLSAKIQAIHPYEVPEIIGLPIIAGSAAYLTWIAETMREA